MPALDASLTRSKTPINCPIHSWFIHLTTADQSMSVRTMDRYAVKKVRCTKVVSESLPVRCGPGISQRNMSQIRSHYSWISFLQYVRQLARQFPKALKDVQSGRHSKATHKTSRNVYFTGCEEKVDNAFSDNVNMPSDVETSNCCTTARLNP